MFEHHSVSNPNLPPITIKIVPHLKDTISKFIARAVNIEQPEPYKQIVETPEGPIEIENPIHEENDRRQQRYLDEANDVLVKILLVDAIDVDMDSDIVQQEIQKRAKELKFIYGSGHDIDLSDDLEAKLFYLREVFTKSFDELASIINFANEMNNVVEVETAYKIAGMFRNSGEWYRYSKMATTAVNNEGLRSISESVRLP